MDKEHTELQAALAVLEAERVERVRLCQLAIESALTEHRCQMEVQVLLRANQVIPQVIVKAIED